MGVLVRLHYGELQTVLVAVFALLAATMAAVFTAVALRTRKEVPFERVRTVGYRLRRPWLAVLVLALATLVGVSLLSLPYSHGAEPTMTVRVIGGQFYWSMSPDSVPAGTRVRFDITGADVNHGFGIYNAGGELLASVQAMPGYHNKIDLTLREPGRYLVSCLEFCGRDHHRMSRTFEVTES